MSSALIFVTGNASKFREAAAILAQLGITLTQHDVPLIEPQCDDARQVARSKARQAYRKLGRPVLVDDATLTLAGYPSFPGAYTAAVARTLGPEGFRRLLNPDHPAIFTSHVALCDGHTRV